MRTIVVGFDGSDASRRALARIAEVAREDAQVIVVHAASSVYDKPYDVGDPKAEERGRHLLDEARELLGKRGIEPELRVVVGDAADEIVGAAKESEADLVAVGRRRSTLSHLLGSVSSKVVSDAPCDVLVVR
jgi:nucleotide-binding universal stress UspA family protein